MRHLERILLSKMKVRVWLVVAALTLAAAGTAVFGAFVKDAAERSVWHVPPRGGALGRVAFRVATIPQDLYHLFSIDSRSPFLASEQRFHGRSGLTVAHGNSRRSPPHGPEAGYLVVMRHVPERGVFGPGSYDFVAELIDLNQRETVHVWKLENSDVGKFEYIYALPDGSLIVNFREGDLLRMDPCSNVVWRKSTGAHHSIERDANGNFWMPWYVVPSTLPQIVPGMREDGLISISPDGEVLSRTALSGALIRGGHRHLLYGIETEWNRKLDPFHMNDVEPVLEDGPFWRRGDLFVSLRTSSVVLLYRPATDEVLWLRSGPWLHQHDVDIVSESEISVFSNNAAGVGDGKSRVPVLDANEVYVYDFATGEARSPWREAMRRHDVRTSIKGSATVLDDGGLIVVESAHGRVLRLSAGGELVWSYVNRAPDGLVYPLWEIRYLDAEYGASMAHSITSFDCEAGRTGRHAPTPLRTAR